MSILTRLRAWLAWAGCTCGCPRSAHQHYRPGTDCSWCPCTRWRRAWHPAATPDRITPAPVPR